MECECHGSKNVNYKPLSEIDEAYLLIKYGKLLQERHFFNFNTEFLKFP